MGLIFKEEENWVKKDFLSTMQYMKTRVVLEPCQIFKVELFAKGTIHLVHTQDFPKK